MYEWKERVRFSEVDEKGKQTSISLLNYFQDCCTLHSEDVGFGLEWLFERHCGWFVTSWQIHMYRMPHMGEYVTVKTYPTNVKGFFGVRDFIMETESGELLAKAHSNWVYMNHKEGKPERVPAEMVQAYQKDEPIEGKWEKGKLRPLEDEREVATQVVSHAQLDYNGHMNNVYFLQMGILALPEDTTYNRIRIEFRMQAKENETIHLYRAQTEKGYQVTMRSDKDEIHALLCFTQEEESCLP